MMGADVAGERRVSSFSNGTQGRPSSPELRRTAGVALVVICLPCPAATYADQQPGRNTETVSREVMTLLMSGPGMTSGQFELRVGAAPDDFPLELLPPDTTIDASAIASGASTVVGANTSLTASDLFAQLPRITAAGWSNAGPPIRGFVNRAVSMALAVCRNQEFAVINFMPREAGGVFARVTVRHERSWVAFGSSTAVNPASVVRSMNGARCG